jgi:hypothetical protein
LKRGFRGEELEGLEVVEVAILFTFQGILTGLKMEY